MLSVLNEITDGSYVRRVRKEINQGQSVFWPMMGSRAHCSCGCQYTIKPGYIPACRWETPKLPPLAEEPVDSQWLLGESQFKGCGPGRRPTLIGI